MKEHRLTAPLIWAVLYFVAGYLSHLLNGPFAATGYIWLPAGITVSALLLTLRRRWWPLLICLFVAQMLLGWVEHRNLLRMALFAFDEIGVAAIVVALMRRASMPVEGLFFVRWLLVVSVVCGVISGLIGGSWFFFVQNVPFWQTARVWAASDAVAILIVTPVIVGWSRFRAHRSGGIARSDFILGLLSFVALLVTTYVAFDSNIDRVLMDIDFATTYVPLFFVAAVTLLWGGRGGSLAVAALALMTFGYTAAGKGPFVELARFHASHALLESQIYLSIAALLSLLTSALKTTREQLHESAVRWKSNVELALTVSRQLAYSLDPLTQTLSWSGDTVDLLGLPANRLSTLAQVLAHVHEADREPLQRRWFSEPDADIRADFQFRLLLPAGGISIVTDMSRSLLEVDDSLSLVAGVWHLTETEVGLPRSAQ